MDHTILVTVNDIAAQQSKATTETEAKVNKLLNYVATHPNATLTYHKSKMQLAVHRAASYLSAPNARSRAGGYFYLRERDNTNFNPPINAPVHTECKIMKHVLSSATEAEIGAIFLNCQQAEILRTTLQELGHPQYTTTIVTDNATANNIINGKAKQKQTKAMDMRYNWILDRQVQRHFHVIWKPKIWQITSQNIILPYTTNGYVLFMSLNLVLRGCVVTFMHVTFALPHGDIIYIHWRKYKMHQQSENRTQMMTEDD